MRNGSPDEGQASIESHEPCDGGQVCGSLELRIRHLHHVPWPVRQAHFAARTGPPLRSARNQGTMAAWSLPAFSMDRRCRARRLRRVAQPAFLTWLTGPGQSSAGSVQPGCYFSDVLIGCPHCNRTNDQGRSETPAHAIAGQRRSGWHEQPARLSWPDALIAFLTIRRRQSQPMGLPAAQLRRWK